MPDPENPPGFVVRTEAQKAAWDNGYRLEHGIKDGWLHYGSTTAPGSLWIAGASPQGPWLLSIDHSGVVAEIGTFPASSVPGPGLATFILATLAQLHAALDRVYKLAVSLPDAPLTRFQVKTAGLPRTTEAERLMIQRIGQDVFRDALMDYWGGRCPLTGITEPALLRASHIVPWADCSDEQRLDVHNGLLLSALWDAAFDQGLVSFADNGSVLASSQLSEPRARRWTSTTCRCSPDCARRTGRIWRFTEPAMDFDVGLKTPLRRVRFGLAGLTPSRRFVRHKYGMRGPDQSPLAAPKALEKLPVGFVWSARRSSPQLDGCRYVQKNDDGHKSLKRHLLLPPPALRERSHRGLARCGANSPPYRCMHRLAIL
jgi:HNH endonuclease